MSTELQEQIRLYARSVEDHQTPIGADEVIGRDGVDVVLSRDTAVVRPWLTRGPRPALVAALVVLVVFGLFAWVLPGQEPTPPAETVPGEPPALTGTPHFTTSAIPDGFAVAEYGTLGSSHIVYLAESGGDWLPADGGFAIDDVSRVYPIPDGGQDAAQIVEEYAPGAERVTIGGRTGAILEATFSQDGITTPIIWALGVDERGAVFEVSAVGMSRDEVLAIADGVRTVTIEVFLETIEAVDWDVKVDLIAEGLTVDVPADIEEAADAVRVVVGSDLLLPRLSRDDGGTTVVTTDTGEIVESDGDTIRVRAADLFLRAPDEAIEDMLAAYPGNAQLSPAQRERRIDRYLDQIGPGVVLSEDPYVAQVAPGPEPRFDVTSLGEELPLTSVESADAVPSMIFDEFPPGRAVATATRPVLVIGSVEQPGAEEKSVHAMVWFTEAGDVCSGSGDAETMGSSCGQEVLGYLGFVGANSGGGLADVTYAVPLETSVVQVVTGSGNYWQRPRGGYGVIAYGGLVTRPDTIVAYDAAGNEIGRWENPDPN